MTIALRSMAIGAFPSRADAEKSVGSLLEEAFGPDQIGIVVPDAMVPVGSTEGTGPTTIWAGAMFRSLIGVEIPDSELRYYEEAIQGGGALVMVKAGDRYPEAMDILHRFGGEYLQAF
jgi:hypothetical protein